jgi:hypothetical protein
LTQGSLGESPHVASPKTKIFDDVDAGARARLPARLDLRGVVSTIFSEREDKQQMYLLIQMSFHGLPLGMQSIHVDGMIK